MKMEKERKTEKIIKYKTNKNFMINKYSKNIEKVKKIVILKTTDEFCKSNSLEAGVIYLQG